MTQISAQNPDYDEVLIKIQNWDSKNDITWEIQVDAEWAQLRKNTPNTFIALTFKEWKPNAQPIFLEHPGWRRAGFKQHYQSWDEETPLPLLLGAREVDKPNYQPRQFRLRLDIFFSEGDIRAFLGERLSRILFKTYLVRQKIIRHQEGIEWIELPYYLEKDGKIRQLAVKIRDHSGYKTGGLESAADKSGIPMPHKGLMDVYKDRMHIAYDDPQLRPQFIQYAKGDLILDELFESHKRSIEYLTTTLGINNLRHPPMTKGRTVAETLLQTIQAHIPFAAKHLELLDIPYEGKPTAPIKYLLDQCSVKTLIAKEKEFTSRFLGLTMGGRCKNELPETPAIRDLVVSMDLQSCYGTALKFLKIPIGMPTFIEEVSDKPKSWMTLDQFLNKYEKELVPDCWHAVIDTGDELLSFDQNVIFSKHVHGTIELESEDDVFDNDGHFKGDFVLQLRKITNGILTHHSLQTLKAVATNKEWGELKKKIRIKAAMLYKKSNQCLSIDEFLASVETNKGRRKTGVTSNGGNFRNDTRTRAWYAFPMERFIKPLLERRAELKKEMKQFPVGSEKYAALNALQEDLKETINSTYGAIASPYFPISNPISSNNITDAARMACWAMVLVSGGLTAITDGSEACLNTFRMWVNKFPGLDTCAKLARPKLLTPNQKDYLKIMPLGGARWGYKGLKRTVQVDGKDVVEYGLESDADELIYGREGQWSAIDELYEQHIKEFFQGKELTWLDRYSYEAKDIYKGIAIQSQSNYLVERLGGGYKVKARGHETKKSNYRQGYDTELEEAPIQTILKAIYEGKSVEPQPQHYTKEPLKLSMYQQRIPSKEQQEDIAGLLPGDTYTKRGHVKAISHTMFYYQTYEQWLKWKRRADHLKRKYGWSLEGDYVDEEGCLDYPAALQDIQHRIDNNLDPKGHGSPHSSKNPFWQSY